MRTNSNTSYVLIYPQPSTKERSNNTNSNTSYVLIYRNNIILSRYKLVIQIHPMFLFIKSAALKKEKALYIQIHPMFLFIHRIYAIPQHYYIPKSAILQVSCNFSQALNVIKRLYFLTLKFLIVAAYFSISSIKAVGNI